MGDIVERNQPCLSETCDSSDGRQVYADKSSYCYSCETYFNPKKNSTAPSAPSAPSTSSFRKSLPIEKDATELKEYRPAELKERGIIKVVAEFYDVRVKYNDNGEVMCQYFPYDEGTTWQRKHITAESEEDKWRWIGPKTESLFGMDKFNKGGRRLVICEGALDALSVQVANFKKWGKMYPVIACPSASSVKLILENRDYVRSFDEVVICFDNDKAGRKATDQAVKIVGYDKAKVVKIGRNDMNDVLMLDGDGPIISAIFDAESITPSGIISREDIWNALVSYSDQESVPYPACLDSFNSKLKGRRGGEIVLVISGTGSGKSTIIREIALDAVVNNGEIVGVLPLEESPAETARKFSAMQLNRNPAEEVVPIDELRKGFVEVFGEEGTDERLIVLDHQGSLDGDDAVDKMEYMCLRGATLVIIDHITILVSEGTGDKSGNEAHDSMMNSILTLAKRYTSTCFLVVSHLRKAPVGGKSFEEGKIPSIDDIKGSGSIKQIANDIIAVARDMTHVDDGIRNSIAGSILKARFSGLTGPVNGFHYIQATGRIKQGTFIDPAKEGVSGFKPVPKPKLVAPPPPTPPDVKY